MSETKPYEGHRDRLRKKAKKHGLEMLEDYERLELILFYVIPRQDTYLLAKSLLKKFGSLSGVINATANELEEVDGIGEKAAFFISQFLPLFKHYMKEISYPKKSYESTENIVEYMRAYTLGAEEEHFYIIVLNSKSEIITVEKLGEGRHMDVSVKVAAIAKCAVLHDSTKVVIAHNHTTGIISPSEADVKATVMISNSLATIGITLVDSFIFDNKSYFSFKEKRGKTDLRLM